MWKLFKMPCSWGRESRKEWCHQKFSVDSNDLTKDPFGKFTFFAIPSICNLHHFFFKSSYGIWISANLSRKSSCLLMILKIFSKLEHKLETIMLFKTNGENLKQNKYLLLHEIKSFIFIRTCWNNFNFRNSVYFSNRLAYSTRSWNAFKDS